jgi:UDP-N-acetylglucosamine diphosphorylase / glucose-1-phosphate thymidylyltransferase / UDP-N-acetylgalactosamine diphosphorylase / glucosamine-1-phosphate N-acetyltransferase / galactosamine-1-phosphate N-acetyltransferase
MKITNSAFFDTADYAHSRLFVAEEYPWQPLALLKAYMAAFPYPSLPWPQRPGPLPRSLVLHAHTLYDAEECRIEYGDACKGRLTVHRSGLHLEGASVLMAGAVLAGGPLSLGQGVLVESGAFIKGPTIIGDRTEIRQGAYLRGHCLVGARCVVGHVTEVKHAILLDGAKAGHFAYLGDSILGNEVNLGAGTKLANLRFGGGEILVKTEAGPIASGLRKFGAVLGDRVQTGCNAVTNPGTVLGKKSMVLPNTTVPSGWHRSNSLIR